MYDVSLADKNRQILSLIEAHEANSLNRFLIHIKYQLKSEKDRFHINTEKKENKNSTKD